MIQSRTMKIIVLGLIGILIEFALLKDLYYQIAERAEVNELNIPTNEKEKLLDTLEMIEARIASNPMDHELYYIHSQIESKLNPKSGLILAYLQRAHELYPGSPLYNRRLADHFIKKNDHKKALEYLKELISIKGGLSGKMMSEIYCDIAQINYDNNDIESFRSNLKKARDLWPYNWRIDLLDFTQNLKEGRYKEAKRSLKISYENYERYEKEDPLEMGAFRHALNGIARGLIAEDRFVGTRLLYDFFAIITQDPGNILADLEHRFSRSKALKEKIWGDRITLEMYNPALNDVPILKSFNRSCPIKDLKHVLSDDEGMEIIDVTYYNSAGFLDIWYARFKIPIRPEKLSVMIEVETQGKLSDRQVAVEILGKFYYSRSRVTKKEGNRYIMIAPYIYDYILQELSVKPKGYEVFITKIGFNTVCKSGRYKIKSISLYFEQ